MVDADEFLATIFQDVPEGESVLVSKGRRSDGAPTFHIRPTHEAFTDWLAAPRSRLQWFFAAATAIDSGEERLSHRGRDASCAYCIVLDDIGTKVASPPPVAPSWRLETSEGNEQWGYILEPTEDLEAVEGVLTQLAAAGWTDKACINAERFFRMPGVWHAKKAFRARLVEWEPSRFWTLEALASEFGVDPAVRIERQKRIAKASLAGARVINVVDEVLEWLSEEGLVVADEPVAGRTAIVCPWADQHTDGRNEAFYYSLGRGDDEWIEMRGFRCFHEHCKDRRYADLREWMADRGGPDRGGYDPLPWLQSRYVFVTEGSRIVDKLVLAEGGTAWNLDFADWSNEHHRKVPLAGYREPVVMKTAFIADERTTKARRTVHKPGGGAMIQEQGGTLAINTYAPPCHVEVDGPPDAFLGHVEFILPDVMERELFLNWLAYKAQHPASRSYAIIMLAEGFGVGRSWVTRLLADVFGHTRVKTAKLGNLLGLDPWTDWGSGAQFVTIEEGKGVVSKDDFWHSYEHIKEIIDVRPVRMRTNTKYGAMREEEMFFNLLINTNNPDAFMLPDNDRRFAVLSNPPDREDEGYYEKLWAASDGDEAARVYWWLMARDVTGYSHVYPPMTEAKEIMIELSHSSRDSANGLIMAALEGDIASLEQIAGISNDIAARQEATDKELPSYKAAAERIWKKAARLRGPDGKLRDGRRIRLSGAQQYVRCIRNAKKWLPIDAADAADMLIDEAKKNDRAASRPLLVPK